MPPARVGDDGCRPENATGKPIAAAYASAGGLAGGAPGLLDPELVDRRLGARRLEVRAGGWRRGRLRALVVLARPSQWVKNLLVVAAPAAAGVLVRDDVPMRVVLAFAAFCLLSAGTYIVNDVCDVHEDRGHPRKRHRPVAAGELEPRTALVAAAALMLAGLALCILARPLLLVVGAGYLAITLTYTAVWRRIAIVDVGAIAAGFVLRAVAGGVAAPVALSRSFVLVVAFAAVFVAAGKRHGELARARSTGAAARPVLGVYTARRLRQVLVASASLAFAAYCVWALEHHSAHGLPWRQLTIVPFAACLARYGLLLRRGGGEAPEELLLEDRFLQLLALARTIVFALSVHAAR
jgi:decaprenyl-phosphate phosphoribosyltransferase